MLGGGVFSWTQCSSGRQPNFGALNRGLNLCSAGRPSGWALAHILVNNMIEHQHTVSCHDVLLLDGYQ